VGLAFFTGPAVSDDIPCPPVATISVLVLMLVQFGVVFRPFKALVAIWTLDCVLDSEIGPT
jgi:hypothetical protein